MQIPLNPEWPIKPAQQHHSKEKVQKKRGNSVAKFGIKLTSLSVFVSEEK